MIEVRSQMPKYDDDEAHVVRRLGWAVVAQWQNLTDEARNLLERQALLVDDQEKFDNLEQTIRRFIRKHEGGI